ncbi:MAG: hypothetical protein KGD65_05890 [Candidatus Lokiarchaeota archaeon]|nr:hypothetical protein [Candidatus Lokiarchaeota archaeon]
MKSFNNTQNYETPINGKLEEIANFSYNLNNIPPIIGIIIADQFGNTIMVLEYENKPEENYGSIKSYLSDDNKNLLEIDLISMYFSSFKTFAGQTNIQNLSNLEIHGSNIKVQLHYLLEKYMVIIFLNSKVDLNLKEKEYIIQYFEDILIKYEFEFQHFNDANSRKILRILENKGRVWLKKLNKTYVQTFQHNYLKKHEFLELIIKKISPTIESVLSEYLERIPEEFINDISRELKNKIHDKISEFKFNLE